MAKEIRKLERIKEIWDIPDYNESVRKAHKMTTHAMLEWIDTHLNDIGQAATDYRKTGDESYLLELRKAVCILQALTEELMVRKSSL
jgi:hypothetical protein